MATVCSQTPAPGQADGPVAGDLEGPAQGPVHLAGARAGNARRQYCWWITFSAPYPETAARLQLRSPTDLSRESFLDAVRAAYTSAGQPLAEAAVFLELHRRTDQQGDRVPHLNALVRAETQHVDAAPGARDAGAPMNLVRRP